MKHLEIEQRLKYQISQIDNSIATLKLMLRKNNLDDSQKLHFSNEVEHYQHHKKALTMYLESLEESNSYNL